jgi:DNA-directed RNA polymerase specialized sigma24 family protein
MKRKRRTPHYSCEAMEGTIPTRKPLSGMKAPGVFQCTLLRALELPKAYREVFLLKEIQGHTLAEIATLLGISTDTALLRLKRAHREIGAFDSDAVNREQA